MSLVELLPLDIPLDGKPVPPQAPDLPTQPLGFIPVFVFGDFAANWELVPEHEL